MLLNTKTIAAITGLSQSTIAKYANPGEKYKYYTPKLTIADQRIENGKVMYYYDQEVFEAWLAIHKAKGNKGVRKSEEVADATNND